MGGCTTLDAAYVGSVIDSCRGALANEIKRSGDAPVTDQVASRELAAVCAYLYQSGSFRDVDVMMEALHFVLARTKANQRLGTWASKADFMISPTGLMALGRIAAGLPRRHQTRPVGTT